MSKALIILSFLFVFACHRKEAEADQKRILKLSHTLHYSQLSNQSEISYLLNEIQSKPESTDEIFSQVIRAHDLTALIINKIDSIKYDLLIEFNSAMTTGNTDQSRKEIENYFLHGHNTIGKGYLLNSVLTEYTTALNSVSQELYKLNRRLKPIQFLPILQVLYKQGKFQVAESDDSIHVVNRLFTGNTLPEALALLEQIKWNMLEYEKEILSKVQALKTYSINDERLTLIVAPPTRTVMEGELYHADLFFSHFLTAMTIPMKVNGKSIPVENDWGKVAFIATDGRAAGTKKQWQGSIHLPKPGGGDTIIYVKQTYFVYSNKR